jgi:hypothetical protein
MVLTLTGLALIAAAALFIAWPLFFAAEDPGVLEVAESPSVAARLVQQKEKNEALAAIKDAEFDHQLGKLSDEDYGALRAELEARALVALAALEEPRGLRAVASAPATAAPGRPAASGAAPASPQSTASAVFCPGCGQRSKKGVHFCPHCGRKQPASERGGRKRA